ncbi:MAG: hypothetical protein NTY77_05015 [Elusimicrobia bacterium]|nr:hypothetical protein [Elusimicrobiota bacterium]
MKEPDSRPQESPKPVPSPRLPGSAPLEMSRDPYTPRPRFQAPGPPRHGLTAGAVAAFLAVAAAFLWTGFSRMKTPAVAVRPEPVRAVAAVPAPPAPETAPADSTMMVLPGALREEVDGVSVTGGERLPPVEQAAAAPPQQALREVFWDGRTAAATDGRQADVVRYHHTIMPGYWANQRITFRAKVDGSPSGRDATFGPAELNRGLVYFVLIPGRSRPHSIVVDMIDDFGNGTVSRTRTSAAYDGNGRDKWVSKPLESCYFPGGIHGAGKPCGP